VLAALEPLPLDRRCLELVVSVKAAWERFAMPDVVEIAEEARRVALLASPALTTPYFAYTRTMVQSGFTSRITSFLERLGPAVAGDRDWTLMVRLGLLTVNSDSSAEEFLALVREFDPPAGEARVRCLTEAAIRSSEPGPLLDQAEEVAGDRPDHQAMVALARASCGQDVEANLRRARDLEVGLHGPVHPLALQPLVRLARLLIDAGRSDEAAALLVAPVAELRRLGDPCLPLTVELDLLGMELASTEEAAALAERALLRIDPRWDGAASLVARARTGLARGG
ncbi:MAG: hypothetical protein ABMA64_34570, partial [Myxococcota bacterium]